MVISLCIFPIHVSPQFRTLITTLTTWLRITSGNGRLQSRREDQREWQEDPNLDILNCRPRPLIPHRLMTIAHFKHAPSAVQCAINTYYKNLTLPWFLSYSYRISLTLKYTFSSEILATYYISGSSNMCGWSESVEYHIYSYLCTYIYVDAARLTQWKKFW